MGLGLRALNRLAGSDLLDRAGLRKRVERSVFQGTRRGFRTAGAAGRSFNAVSRLARPARQAPPRAPALFDLTPDDEQRMLREAINAFAAERIRPAALIADGACATPPEILALADELGGVMAERSAVTSVLVTEALARGDLGIALAALAPSAVATALGLWGDGEQQSTYLPAFASGNAPAAALALLEPRPLFDPMRLETRARADAGGWILNGAKALVPRAAEAELFVVAAEA